MTMIKTPDSSTLSSTMTMTMLRLTILWLCLWSTTAFFGPSPSLRIATQIRAGGSSEKPFCVLVETEIEPDRMGDFLSMIENNAKETRKEPGCIRFDVLRSQEAQNKFFFVEIYKNEAAIDHHKAQPHYQSWADFKASGGTLSSTTHKTDGEFLT